VPVKPGWIVQWYVYEPAVLKVWLNDPPGAMPPESQLALVDVCVVLSLLCHVTVVPTATVIGFGEYAVVVIVDAPDTIEIVDPPAGVGVGVGVVIVGELLCPHPTSMTVKAMVPNTRLNIRHAPSTRWSAIGLPFPTSVFAAVSTACPERLTYEVPQPGFHVRNPTVRYNRRAFSENPDGPPARGRVSEMSVCAGVGMGAIVQRIAAAGRARRKESRVVLGGCCCR
jgi:hypothetical protein